MIEITYPPGSMALAKAQLKSIYGKSRLFYDETAELGLKRVELSTPSLNYMLSGKYFGEGSGIPLGKLINVYGMESQGKTAFCLGVARDFLAQGLKVLWIDAERSFDPTYAMNFNIDVNDRENFELMVPDFGEQAYDGAAAFAQNGAVSLIVIDSYSALGTRKTYEKNSEENDVASSCKRLTEHFQNMVKWAADRNVTVMYINQMRDVQNSKFGGKKFTGGNSMKFYPHISIEIKKAVGGDIEMSNGDYVGFKAVLETEKNKTFVPHKKANLIAIPGFGFSRELDILELAIGEKICRKAGSYVYYGDTSVGNGIRQQFEKLWSDTELLDRIEADLKLALDPEVDQTTGEITSELPAIEDVV